MSSGGTLPLEILTDILSRLPVKSLCRLKCVSHSWKSLISDPHFAKTHLNRTNPQYLDQKILLRSTSPHNLYFVVDFANVNPTSTKLDFPMAVQYAAHNWVQVLSSYDGLLLVSHFSHSDESIFSLFNPSTRECKKLPAPPFVLNPVPGVCRYVYGVGYNSSTDDYNVVILSFYITESTNSYIAVEDVYSLNANAWRRIEDAGYVLVGRTSCGFFFNGCLHCLCWRNGSYVILAFNLLDEIFREVPLRVSLRESEMLLGYSVELVRGCLGLVGRRTTCQTEVWMMEEYGVVESWTKFTIDLPSGRPRLNLLCWLPEDNFLFDNNRSTNGENLVV